MIPWTAVLISNRGPNEPREGKEYVVQDGEVMHFGFGT
jgi:ribosome-binding ATPase YchF (GTP1/OBG family)